MTDRLSEITARIDGVRQLGSVVNAMRGIAAARAQQARTQLAAVDAYAASIAAAIGTLLVLMPRPNESSGQKAAKPALVLFCAEQGFAGAFSEHVLIAAGSDLAASQIFLIGTRGAMALAEHGRVADWSMALPSRSQTIPKMADRAADALYARIATGEIDSLVAIFSIWQPGKAMRIVRLSLFPFDFSAFPKPKTKAPPLMDLAPAALIEALAADYLHAQLCRAGLHAFAAENEARMEAMASARNQAERQLASLEARKRAVRQEAITEEVIELAAGETASRSRFI
jgi:F-type H+-transporting ATPase subunit gamma